MGIIEIDELNPTRAAPILSGVSPLDFLRAVYLCTELPLSTRISAAKAALPFCHPKLAVTALISEGSMADRLDRAVARSRRVLDRARPAEPDPIERPFIRRI
jgi:hypothetical protein